CQWQTVVRNVRKGHDAILRSILWPILAYGFRHENTSKDEKAGLALGLPLPRRQQCSEIRIF
ncbi:hypothetical protein RY831_25820, partial [Noviherbaspirillum sp. CPCC 100848]